MKLTDEMVHDWLQSPVTEALAVAMQRQVEMRRTALAEAYLNGHPRSDAERVGVLMIEEWTRDFFGSSAEDLRIFLEIDDDEPQRHQADGIHGAGGTEEG